MVALCQMYREHGFSLATFQVKCFFSQGQSHALVDLEWIIKRMDGLEPWRFNTSYNLMRSADQWQVVLCTAYEESQFLS